MAVRSVLKAAAVAALAMQPALALAQQAPTASIAEMASTPLVRVNIGELLRTPPDEATMTVGTQAKAATATAAVAANKVKTEKLLAAIRAAGIRERDIQTQGIQLQPDYRWDNEPNGRGRQTLIGYIASNSVQIKTRNIDKLTALLDALTDGRRGQRLWPQFRHFRPGPAAQGSTRPGDGAGQGRSDRICAQQRLYFGAPVVGRGRHVLPRHRRHCDGLSGRQCLGPAAAAAARSRA